MPGIVEEHPDGSCSTLVFVCYRNAPQPRLSLTCYNQSPGMAVFRL
ncbi:hypothetical protein RSSM_02405 [Rhodopirellula sallentina SM41]|uniref:Uncharacterized protein n=1 Tax=Rhodopirellula sallentina SM41 TaxID=1263870 RepID=M5UE67_9BACT|nr:hypothetical protein RSSM_02405 [Rhodopirellula sallentina SM41]